MKAKVIENLCIGCGACQALAPEVFELDEQIREVVLSLEKEWTSKNIELDIDLDEVSIKTDKTLLSHVWSNILSNAIKFSNNNSKIDL